MRYFVFSKSMWTEPPRLRHQLARLLLCANRDVVFFERPRYPWEFRNVSSVPPQSEPRLRLRRTTQLVHHQLRVTSALCNLNANYEIRSIRGAAPEPRRDDIIVNFNYDYVFLRALFPDNRVCTVINDDFVAQSRLRGGRHAREALARTCELSDVVLTVSYPLIRQLERWCSPKLFLPWADCGYAQAARGGVRNGVLLWAHIDHRIDFDLLEFCCLERPQYRFFLVGPCTKGAHARISRLIKLPNVIATGAQTLDQLPMGNFFSAILPYKRDVAEIAAITLANKSLQLMARGLPLVTHGMPEFYDHSAILKAGDASGLVSSLDQCHRNYDELQEPIRLLIDSNQAEDRLRSFDSLLGA